MSLFTALYVAGAMTTESPGGKVRRPSPSMGLVGAAYGVAGQLGDGGDVDDVEWVRRFAL
ncbi:MULTISPECIES: hypothetical protein [unclassified Micromonospora]|uniref:hypothetical protein n=1 Tax=unclassified Micromonospora TaxID=2617518 RepID=UPI003A84BD4C